MTREEAISALQFDMDMMLFDPYTGDSYSKEILENKSKHGNSMDYPVYCAKEVAIKSLQAWDDVLAELKEAKSHVPVNRLLDDILKDKPKELGMLIAYEKAIEIIMQKLEDLENQK